MNIQNPSLRFGAIVVYRSPEDIQDQGLRLPALAEEPEKTDLWVAPLRVQVVPANQRPTPETGIYETLPAGAVRIGAGLIDESPKPPKDTSIPEAETFTNNHFKKNGDLYHSKIERMDKVFGLQSIKGVLASLMAQSSHYRGYNPNLIRHQIMTQLLHTGRTIERTIQQMHQKNIVEYKLSKPSSIGP